MQQQALTPYDTGERCEAKPWIPYGTKVGAATPAENFGKVDFEDDEGHTVCVVHVERNADGRHTVTVQSLCEDEDLVLVLQRQDGAVVNVDATATT